MSKETELWRDEEKEGGRDETGEEEDEDKERKIRGGEE
jgi:hypothetical protein